MKLREGLADVLNDTRYITEWSNCVPYGPKDFLSRFLAKYQWSSIDLSQINI